MAKTLLLAGNANGGSTTTANTDGFWNLSGLVGIDNTTEANKEIKIQQAGTISNLYAVVATNSIASANTTIITRKNAGNGGQTLTIGSSATGEFEDTTNTDSISAADRICAKFHPGAASGTLNIRQISVLFNATTDTVSVLSCEGAVSFTTASTTYFTVIEGYLANLPPTTETFAKCRIRKTFTAKKLGAYVSANRATNTTIRTRKNGANGGQTITVTGGGASGWYEDTSGTDSLVAGDDFNYSIVTGTGTDTLTIQRIKCEYNSTGGDGLSTGGRSTGTAINDNTTGFSPLGGMVDFTNTSESASQGKARVAFTYSNLEVMVSQNDVSSASTLDLRKGAASQAVTVSITGSLTGLFEDTTHTYAGATGDEMNFRLVVPSVAGSHTVTVTSATIHTKAGNDVSKTLTETTNISDSLARLDSKFRSNTETVTITEATFTRLAAKNRALATQTTTISDSITKVRGRPRAPATQTVTVSDSIARMAAKTRANTESTTIGETLTRQDIKNRALPTETITVTGGTLTRVKGSMRSLATQTITVSDSISRLAAKNRIISSVVSIGETLTRLAAKNRALATQTVTTSDNVTALKGGGANNVVRTITETVNISEQLTRLASKFRSLATETTTISSSVTRLKAANRILPTESVTVGSGTLSRLAAKIRNPIENVSIGEALSRLTAKKRAISESTTIASSVTRTKGVSRSLATQTVTVSDSIARQCSKIRSKIETVISGESLSRLSNKFRSISETVIVSDIVNRTKISGSAHNVVRTLVETVIISDSLIRSVYRDLRNRVASGGAGGRRLKRLIHSSFTLKHRSFKL